MLICRGELHQVAVDKWPVVGDDIRQMMARLAAAAAWGLGTRFYLFCVNHLQCGNGSPSCWISARLFLETGKLRQSIHSFRQSIQSFIQTEHSFIHSFMNEWDDMTWHDMTWHDMTWHDMTWHDMKGNQLNDLLPVTKSFSFVSSCVLCANYACNVVHV